MISHHGPVIATRDGLTVIDCRACGWAHLDPLPAIPDGYYESEFWATKGKGWLARYEAERDWLDMRHGDWLSVVREHTNCETLLDVGCGYGFFMLAAGVSGWKPWGIEPSMEAANYCNDSGTHYGSVFQGTWEQYGSGGRFGCISALWLVEHLPDPMAFLAWCRAHLAEGGALLLAVPNDFSVNQAMANDKVKVPYWWVHPTHLNYWTWQTFANVLGRSGFRIVDSQGTYPMEYYLQAGKDYTADEALGDTCFHEVQQSELKMARADRIANARGLARFGMGRDQIVVAKEG